MESPQKQNSSHPISDFQPGNIKNQGYFPNSLSHVLERQRQSPSPSRSGADSKIVGPYLNKNISNPVPSYEAAFLRGSPIFFPNEPGSTKQGAQSKNNTDLATGTKLTSISPSQEIESSAQSNTAKTTKHDKGTKASKLAHESNNKKLPAETTKGANDSTRENPEA